MDLQEKSLWRDVLAYATNSEIYLDADNVRSLLPPSISKDLDICRDIEPSLASLRVLAETLNQQWSTALPPSDDAAYAKLLRTIVEQTAPTAAATGVALQCVSAPGVFEDPLHLRLMALLADDVGAGAAERWRYDLFRDIARRADVPAVTGTLRDLADQRNIRDGCFRLPALIYAMSRRSDAFDCELIGLDLAWRTIGLLPAWRIITENEDRAHLDLGIGRGAAIEKGADLAAYAREIVDVIGTDPEKRARIAFGISLFAQLLADLDALVSAIVRSVGDPRLAMAILVQDRAREARVYHGDFKLEGRSLSDWFDAAQTDPMPLVDAIGRSRLVRPDAPQRSLLTNGLLRPDGPMFRIFTTEDIDIINRWIASLGHADADQEKVAALPVQVSLRQAPRKVGGGDLDLGVWPSSIRDAYHLLQGRALPPRTREFVRSYCKFWLKQSHASVDKSDRSLPPRWRPGVLRAWLLDSHDSHADAFSTAHEGNIPDRSAVIEQTIQLAPLTLIDGAWLQGFTEASLASTRVGAPLFETYWDELGNGDWTINHPKIYRDVLAAMDITLPPTGSRAFAEDRRLQDASFRLPVYWLCLGKQPVSLRPEILGMNLAMELSGVGGTYRSAHRFLKHHGFPTTFVDLHNTIDNVSTGHSAWAADAIDAYMQSTQDIVSPDISWARIRLGYESLSPIIDDPDELDFFAGASKQAEAVASLKPPLHNPLDQARDAA